MTHLHHAEARLPGDRQGDGERGERSPAEEGNWVSGATGKAQWVRGKRRER